MKTVALDPGNFEIKIADGSSPRAIRSVQYRLPRGINPLKALKNSPIIELENGDRWHVGVQAYKYSSFEQTVIQDKALLAKLHLLASLEESNGEEIRLIVSHHSPEVVEGVLKRELIGRHSYRKNGVACEVDILSVQVVHEGVGCYWAAQQAGYVPETGYTIVIDLGGSSWLYRVIDADGELIAGEVGDRFGSYHLAKQIAADERLKRPLRRFGITAPDPGVILDGFTRGHVYSETGISWAEYFTEFLDPWFKTILSTVKTACTAHLPSTRRFLVCGGGSHLVADKLRGNSVFVVMPDPSYSNVIGMYEHATPPLSIAA